ncbi:uncharacterized protein KY384_006820 [Bacidia gigantensis]|uniref:uncharacterized protein n=1 Tax=Bacidia gigantensis TaxID=2732470 RepID=UPI001D054536|nr:uncharacterized protein KY384_006820 [Bacidia gigantensis]KAG8527904.1 hypothetical protein KY384_006820 [Bacidia gigantensis]
MPTRPITPKNCVEVSKYFVRDKVYFLSDVVVGGLVRFLEVFTKRLPNPGETLLSKPFEEHLGGKGASAAVAAYRLSHKKPKGREAAVKADSHTDEIRVQFVGAVGADGYGPRLLKKLEENGVETHKVRTVKEASSGRAVVIVEDRFRENRVLYDPGANHMIHPGDLKTLEDLTGGSVPALLVTQLELRRDTIEQVIETANRAHVDVLLNPAPALSVLPNILPMITHLVMNRSEAQTLSANEPLDENDPNRWSPVAEYFLSQQVQNVVITLSRQGAYYANDSDKDFVEAEKDYMLVDTTGAGDTFIGAYAVEYVRQKQLGQWDIKAAVAYGCKASARTVEQTGCLDPIPWSDAWTDETNEEM